MLHGLRVLPKQLLYAQLCTIPTSSLLHCLHRFGGGSCWTYGCRAAIEVPITRWSSPTMSAAARVSRFTGLNMLMELTRRCSQVGSQFPFKRITKFLMVERSAKHHTPFTEINDSQLGKIPSPKTLVTIATATIKLDLQLSSIRNTNDHNFRCNYSSRLMKQLRRNTRICILSLLFLSVFAPILLLYESNGFIEDLSSFKGRRDLMKPNLVKQDEGGGLREPILNVYKDVNVDPTVGSRFPDLGSESDDLGSDESNGFMKRNEGDIDAKGNNEQRQEEKRLLTSGIMGEVSRATLGHNQEVQPQARRVMDMKIKEMKDQLIRAKAYLNFAIPAGNTHLIKELRLRIKELERAMGDVNKDSDLSRRAFQRMRSMETSLQKSARAYPDCSSMVKKLRAMADNAEELVRVQKEQESFLVQLAGRTTPKGLHCLSMRLTAEYFALNPEERKLPSNPDVHDSNLYHFVVFSDNVLACSVVVDSTVSSAKEPGKIVFHVVTDSLNYAAFLMWFVLHPPREASVQIHNTGNFDWFSTKYDPPNTDGHESQDPRYSSTLNHLRFYLPDIFPTLDKIVLLDHDVVVQKDLTHLWRVNMMGKVNGAVKTCQGNDPAFHRMDLLLNLSDSTVGRRFSNEACMWVFGVNVFDMQKWRKRNLTSVYEKYLQLGKKKPMWKAGTLPLGWMTFYNQTIDLDQKWQIHGLGYHSGIKQEDIEHAAVIHYDGVMKPWLDIGIEKYKTYWRKHVEFSHPYLQQCNIA